MYSGKQLCCACILCCCHNKATLKQHVYCNKAMLKQTGLMHASRAAASPAALQKERRKTPRRDRHSRMKGERHQEGTATAV